MNVSRVGLVCLLTAGTVANAQQVQQTTPATAAPAAPATATAPATPAPTALAPAATPAVPAAAAAPAGPDASGRYTLHEGDDVDLTFAQALSSKTASEGDPVELVLADDIKVGNVVVIKAGVKAFGEVTKAEKNGMMGKPGQLNVRLDYLKVGETKVKLRGTKGKEGASGTTGTVVLAVLFGPLGLIHHGSNVEIKKGQALHAYIGDDIALLPAS